MTTQTKAEQQSDAALRLLHITDNHLFADAKEGRHGIRSADSLRQVLQAATRSRQPDLVVETGDVTHDSEVPVYQAFLDIVDEYVECPLIATPGNHDLNEPFDVVLSRETVAMNGWRIVSVDTHVDNEVGGYVVASEFDRLKQELEEDDIHVLVIGHHPAMPIGCEWIDAHRMSNGEAFMAALASYPHVRGYLSGHVHQAHESESQAIKLMTTPSTCWQFKAGSNSFAIDELLAGWRWLDLHPDGRIETSVERLSAPS